MITYDKCHTPFSMFTYINIRNSKLKLKYWKPSHFLTHKASFLIAEKCSHFSPWGTRKAKCTRTTQHTYSHYLSTWYQEKTTMTAELQRQKKTFDSIDIMNVFYINIYYILKKNMWSWQTELRTEMVVQHCSYLMSRDYLWVY